MNYEQVKKTYKNGDWVFGIGEHKGCSEVFDIETDKPQPFSYLSSNNLDDFRLATKPEIEEAKQTGGYVR